MSSFYYFSIANAPMVNINKEQIKKSVSVVVIPAAAEKKWTELHPHFIRNHISPVSYYWLIILLLLPSWLDYVIFYTFFCIWCSFWCWYTRSSSYESEKLLFFVAKQTIFQKPSHDTFTEVYVFPDIFIIYYNSLVSFLFSSCTRCSNKIKTKSIICLLNSFSVLYFERHMQRPTKHDIEEIWIAFSVIVIHEVMLSNNNGAQNNLFMCVF